MDLRNHFSFEGNLVRDPQLSYTAGGTPECRYVVANSRVYFVGDERREEPCFLPVRSYGRQAENDHRYLRKGSGVTVSGRIQSWWMAQSRKGGFNFDLQQVIYRTRPGDPGQREDGEQLIQGKTAEDWLREYEQAEAEAGVA